MQNTREFNNLTEIVESFQKPSLTIKSPVYGEYQCFAYNENFDSFIFGFETGEVHPR